MVQRKGTISDYPNTPIAWMCLKVFLAGLIFVLGVHRAVATDSIDGGLHIPSIGDNSLNILSPTTLELVLINTKQPNPGLIDTWNWVSNDFTFTPPDMSSVKVIVNGQTNAISRIGFKRRPIYAPLIAWDLRIANHLYLQLGTPITNNQSVQVINDGTVWPNSMTFSEIADPLRYNSSIHVNQEGYLPALPKKAIVGAFIGDLGELVIPTNRFALVDAQSGATVFQATLTQRHDAGYLDNPAPYQNVFEADFSAFATPGQYRVMVPGMGASLPFRIDAGIGMDFARTYALGIFHQRSGTNVTMPFTRFTHAADHLTPATVPVDNSAPFSFTWATVANYSGQLNSDNPPQVAPQLTGPTNQLYPFVNQTAPDVSGGHFEAGDYNRVSFNSAQLIHSLVFAADSLPGVGQLDNLGLPESGDGISDVLQEAKWEADFLAKMQDADGGFYYSVYPQNREYEDNVLPENGDPQVVWPKNTSSTAAAVAALAQCAGSPRFKQAFPLVASNYLAKAFLGWQFLTNAIAVHGTNGAYQLIQHFGDDFTDHDELAWAACELYVTTGDAQYQTKLLEWFPDPTDLTTTRWGWIKMYACYGNAIRDYAFAVRNGRLQTNQIQPDYLDKCIVAITNCANDNLGWSQDSAYGISFPDLTKAYHGGGWYFSPEQAFDLVVAYQFVPSTNYLDAILLNLNYEAGCNPVNVSYITGLGWKRQRNVVDQYSINSTHALPKSGIPISNLIQHFYGTWTYQQELGTLMYPSDYTETNTYSYYDRWCDDWNVSTEASTTDTARSFATAAWLAAQTSLTNQTWKSTNALIVSSTNTHYSGEPMSVTLQVADTNLNNARIVWEVQNQEPSFDGQTHSFTPAVNGSYRLEAEVQWPDGRRAFATNFVNVIPGVPLRVSHAHTLTNGFTFLLSGNPNNTYVIQASTNLLTWQPISTNVMNAGGSVQISDTNTLTLSHRYYRAVKSP